MDSVICSTTGIKPISKGDVHRICSGQVVLTLATAVKELVENSLDAGATVIEVRFKDYGSELIEVSDNGSGVHPDNFQALTLKHHTSKLQEFSDLLSVETFGFRGEALSSLCALSEVSIITRHSSSQCGTRLTFNTDGIITSSTPVARQIGTTVSLKNIFSTIPVRQKEFHRNLKREFAKMTQLLYAYCLVSIDVKITCTNQSKKERKSIIVSTQSGKTVKENISCIFGAKQLYNLVDWEHIPSDDDRSLFHIEGIISSCAHGSGRSTTDRQFFYINSRPYEPTKLMRVVNEVYHQYNLQQNPFVFLNIKAPRNRVDVNVTPDKRQIFLEKEKVLLDVVRESLQKLYEPIPSSFSVNSMSNGMLKKFCSNTKESVQKGKIDEELKSNSENLSIQNTLHEDLDNSTVLKCDSVIEVNQTLLLDTISEEEKLTAQESSCSLLESCVEYQPSSCGENDLVERVNNLGTAFKDKAPNTNAIYQVKCNNTINSSSSSSSSKRSADEVNFKNNKKSKQMKLDSSLQLVQEESKVKQFKGMDLNKFSEKLHQLFSSNSTPKNISPESDVEISTNEKESILNADLKNVTCDSNSLSTSTKVSQDSSSDNNVDCGYSSNESSETVINSDEQLEVPVTDEPSEDELSRTTRTVNITLNEIKTLQAQMIEKQNLKDSAFVRFRALIDPSNNKQAEQELTREISKDMFKNMEVVGHFNLGFIIARLRSDLFIVDQHATDEKYNFETLQKSTTLSNQKLVVPQKLELTPVNESILIENIEIFKANGFEFEINEDALPSEKVSLTSIPMSKNWTFGKEDIDELLFMLQDSPHTLCRPSRVRAMFASRACRKSVMIGTALTESKMKTLLTHMGEIEQPWNCPHGRPTMRHLVNLDMCK